VLQILCHSVGVQAESNAKAADAAAKKDHAHHFVNIEMKHPAGAQPYLHLGKEGGQTCLAEGEGSNHQSPSCGMMGGRRPCGGPFFSGGAMQLQPAGHGPQFTNSKWARTQMALRWPLPYRWAGICAVSTQRQTPEQHSKTQPIT
jgi:hypothetical protein